MAELPSQTLPFRYRFLRSLFYLGFRLLTRVEVRGLERLPLNGPYIFVTNHLHLLDAPLMFALLGQRDATGFIGSTHRTKLFYRLMADWVGGIWLHRGEPDREALSAALEALKQRRILGIAPEGTRSKTGALGPGKEGVAFLVARSRVPLYPVALTHTDKISSAWKRLRRPPIRVVVGERFDLTAVEVSERSQRLVVWTDEIMCRIAALLPPEYRGVYADHPRLKDLTAVSSQGRSSYSSTRV